MYQSIIKFPKRATRSVRNVFRRCGQHQPMLMIKTGQTLQPKNWLSRFYR